MREYGIKVETFQVAGRYQHKVCDIGVKPNREGELSEKVVELLKQANEAAWEDMPQSAGELVSVLKYKVKK